MCITFRSLMNLFNQIKVKLVRFCCGVHEANDEASNQHLILNVAVVRIDLFDVGDEIVALNVLISFSINLCTINVVERYISMKSFGLSILNNIIFLSRNLILSFDFLIPIHQILGQ